MDSIVNPAELPAARQLIRAAAKPDQHGDQDQAVPELQPPFDGFQDHLLYAIAVAPPCHNKISPELFPDIGDVNVEQIGQRTFILIE